jgi:hypothetical protein
MSDIHVQHWHSESQNRFLAALEDYASLPEPLELVILNGDLTEGHPEDYEKLLELLKCRPHPPVYVTMGNHEYYRMWYRRQGESCEWSKTTFPNGWSTEQALEQFTRYFQLERPYYDIRLNNHHFIFLAGEKYRDAVEDVEEDAWLSPEQLTFLESSLARDNKHASAFVFLHQPLECVVQREQLERILNRHPDTIFFSGHTHFQLSSPGTYKESVFAQISSSSVRDPYDQAKDEPLGGTISESLYVAAAEGTVEIKGRRHDEKRWLEQLHVVRKTK